VTIRILSVDDEPEMGDLIRLILGRAGYELVFSSDSHRAWELLHEEPFDLLMQNLMRPDIDGWSFYFMIKADEALHDLPIMIVTAKAQSIDKTLGYHIADVDAYITKPFGPQELYIAIDHVLRKHGKSPPAAGAWKPASPPTEEVHQAFESLIDALKSKRKQKRLSATRALGQLKDTRAVDPLIGMLEDKDTQVRTVAARALGTIGDPRAVAPLVQTLRGPTDAESAPAVSAAYALGDIGDEQAVDPLIETLQDKESHWSVRRAAAWVLGRIGGARALEPLIAALENGVRDAAAQALGQIGDPRAVEPLIAALRDGKYMSTTVIWALGDLEDERAVEPLVELLKDESETIVWAAMRSLAKIGAPAVGPLIEQLNSHWFKDRNVVEALGQVGGQRAVGRLMAMLQDSTADARCTAAWYLGRLGDRRAVEPLVALMQEEMKKKKATRPASIAHDVVVAR
jgi:HEAT repeat protein